MADRRSAFIHSRSAIRGQRHGNLAGNSWGCDGSTPHRDPFCLGSWLVLAVQSRNRNKPLDELIGTVATMPSAFVVKVQEALPQMMGAVPTGDCSSTKSCANKGQEMSTVLFAREALTCGRGSALYGPMGLFVLVLSKAPMSRAASRMRHWRLV